MEAARKTFEINNDVQEVDPTDTLFRYTREEERALENAAPWESHPKYFHTVKISAVALVKMVIHARSGGDYEIMGVMYGKVRDGTFWIMDAAALPVEGTETRVNAGEQAYEYMAQYQDSSGRIGKGEMLKGWYHSHPGYGCWLSGIDVNTQQNNQKFSDPYLAVVIDPNRTVSAGKVEIGAFRTYPEGYKPAGGSSSEYQSIPMDKIEDFGVHADQYYPLKVEIYKTKLDEKLLELLWNKYWVATLSQSLLLSASRFLQQNRAYATSQVEDLNSKINAASNNLQRPNNAQLKLVPPPTTTVTKKGKKEYHGVEDEKSQLAKVAKDSARIAVEAQSGMTTQVLKSRLFNTPLDRPLDSQVARNAAAGVM